MSRLRGEIERIINENCGESGSNTPDFILAEFLTDSLAAYDKAVKARERWYSIESSPGKGTQILAATKVDP